MTRPESGLAFCSASSSRLLSGTRPIRAYSNPSKRCASGKSRAPVRSAFASLAESPGTSPPEREEPARARFSPQSWPGPSRYNWHRDEVVRGRPLGGGKIAAVIHRLVASSVHCNPIPGRVRQRLPPECRSNGLHCDSDRRVQLKRSVRIVRPQKLFRATARSRIGRREFERAAFHRLQHPSRVGRRVRVRCEKISFAVDANPAAIVVEPDSQRAFRRLPRLPDIDAQSRRH